MDWEAPSHDGGGPEGQVQPAAGAAGSGGATADQDLLPRRPADEADDFPGSDDELISTHDAGSGSDPDDEDQQGLGASTDAGWRSMFRRAAPDAADSDPAGDPAGQAGDTELDEQRSGYRVPGSHAARPRAAWSRPRRPNLARPHLSRRRGAPPPATVPPTTLPLAAVPPDAAADQRQASPPLVSRPLVSPRLTADPQFRIWVIRVAVAFVVYFGFMLWHGWRLGLTAVVVWVAADIIYRSKTTAIVPASIRVTSAQRSTRRRLKVLQPAGYLALNACTIPGKRAGTHSIIDHFVVGPAGLYTLNSEKWDSRLPVRTIGGNLYHGPVNQEARLEHSRWEARRAAALIGAELGRSVRVQPVMVVYGPKIPWAVSRLQGVEVFDGGRVGTFFRRQTKATASRHLDATQIAKIFAAAAAAMPPMP